MDQSRSATGKPTSSSQAHAESLLPTAPHHQNLKGTNVNDVTLTLHEGKEHDVIQDSHSSANHREVTFKIYIPKEKTKHFVENQTVNVFEAGSGSSALPVTLTKCDDEVWSGIWETSKQTQNFEYRYEVDGSYGPVRCIDLADGQPKVIYDGAVFYGKVPNASKEKEKSEGILAMLRHNLEDVCDSAKTDPFIKHMQAVKDRQMDLSRRKHSSEAKRQGFMMKFRQAFDGFADEIIREQEVMISSTDVTDKMIISSLLCVIWLATVPFSKAKYLETKRKNVKCCVIRSMEKLADHVAKNQTLSCDSYSQECACELKIALVAVAEAFKDDEEFTWILFIPLIHWVTGDFVTHQRAVWGTSVWWGTAEICDIVEHQKAHENDMYRCTWRAVHDKLVPFFCADEILPFTFLKLLNTNQLTGLLTEAACQDLSYLPAKGVVACVECHMMSVQITEDSEKRGILIDCLLTYILAMRGKSDIVQNDGCLQMAHNILSYTLPSSATDMTNYYKAIQFYLLVLEAIIITDEKESPQDLGQKLEEACTDTVMQLFTSSKTYSEKPNRNGPPTRVRIIKDDDFEILQNLFRNLAEHGKVTNWWETVCVRICTNFLTELAKEVPLELVDKYCKETNSKAPLEKVIKDVALTHVDGYMKAFARMTAGCKPDKIGSNINHSMDTMASKNGSDVVETIKSVVFSPPFVSVWKYYRYAEKQKQAKFVSDVSTEKLDHVTQSLMAVIDRLHRGNISFADADFLNKHRHIIKEMCQSDDSFHNKISVLDKDLDERQIEGEMFKGFHDKVSRFWQICKAVLADDHEIVDIWIQQNNEERLFCESFHTNPKTIKHPVPECIVSLLPLWEKRKDSTIFARDLEQSMKKVGPGNLAAFRKMFRASCDEFNMKVEPLHSGDMSIGNAQQLVEHYYEGKLDILICELRSFLSIKTEFEERKTQLKYCMELKQYHDAVKVVVGLKKEFELTGDFTGMEKILADEGKVQHRLSDLNEALMKKAACAKDFADHPSRIECLEAFLECKEMIGWIRKQVPKKDVIKFVDLVSCTLGEDDMAASKTRELLSVLTGYSALIYDLYYPKDHVDYDTFMEMCGDVWKELDNNPKLMKNLRALNNKRGWLMNVKTDFGNLEKSSIDQARGINSNGLYYVGHIKGFSKDCKSLENVIQLHNGDRKYTYTNLKDLQSRLALVAGEQQKDAEKHETIQRFVALRDAVENLALAYIDIRREGCIQFDDMLVVVHCSSETIALEVRLQSIGQSMIGRVSEKCTIGHCEDLYRYMRDCAVKWRSSMDDKRSKHMELNNFTTEQVVSLRKELGTLWSATSASKDSDIPLVKALPMLDLVGSVERGQLRQFIHSYSQGKSEDAPCSAALTPNKLSAKHQTLMEEIMEEFEEFTQELFLLALEELEDNATLDSLERWLVIYQQKQIPIQEKKLREAEEKREDSLQTCDDLMLHITNTQNESDDLLKKLETLWEKFIEGTQHSINNFLSIDHLGYVLKEIKKLKPVSVKPRKLPKWLRRGKPCLIATSRSQIYQTILRIYAFDGDYTFPSRNEVLLCNAETSLEEVQLFLNRALNDHLLFYCMVNCHILAYNICSYIEQRLSNTTFRPGSGLAFFSDVERSEARIPRFLDKHIVSPPKLTDTTPVEAYVQKILEVPDNIKVTASCVDLTRSYARLLRSARAGVGKSLQKYNLCREIYSDERHEGKAITIPIYKTVDTDGIVVKLNEELSNGYTPDPYNTIHIDIAHEVDTGVDELLFNLLILRSIVHSDGTVWQAQKRQYYIIECMPFILKDGQCAHEVMDYLPTTMCFSPKEVASFYKGTHQCPANFIGFDKDVLAQNEWQIVIKHLDCKQGNDKHYHIKDGMFADARTALDLLIRYCGLADPTWSEIRHYVSFLGYQLQKIEQSVFCQQVYANDLPGFRKFVIDFMLRMAETFATRSLTIAEETPDVNLKEMLDRGEADALQQLKMQRMWGNHPYLFFNEDGETFTPIGFFIKPGPGNTISLVDAERNDKVLLPDCMPVVLKQALDRYKLPMSEDFNTLSRPDMLKKLRDIMVKTVLYKRKVEGGEDAEVPMFTNDDDPDTNYALTMDNAKKILAIHQRLRVGIPVILMGETGCGKTRLIEFMSKIMIPTALKEKIQTMIILKIHGGTTEEDIICKVNEAQNLAKENQRLCQEYANEFHSTQKHSVYTILFLDEANTTEAIGLVKEVLCDGRIRGKPIDPGNGLKIVAACNPYRKHSVEMIKKLKEAGLGYIVGEAETQDKFGHIPMRHLVYRVQALPQSLLPLVWDFGTLQHTTKDDSGDEVDVEYTYIRKMLIKFDALPEQDGLNFGKYSKPISDILAMSQSFMRTREDECSFVSLRDVQRLLQVAEWFYQQRRTLFPAIDELSRDNTTSKLRHIKSERIRSFVLALGVCYIARLEEKTRSEYTIYIGGGLMTLLGTTKIADAVTLLMNEIEMCQNVFIQKVINKDQHINIAPNKALKENVFMMIVCIENRIPLFVVGKPGSSKSLAKSMVSDAMQGDTSRSDFFKKMKMVYMVSFQCSRHATPAGIVGVFNYSANLQKEHDLDNFVSVVVLDEIGLAEDSEQMPLKTLHPLLEDGCLGNEKPEPHMKCAFIGLSNWALDPAKMNRGIFVQRGKPEDAELKDIAREICHSGQFSSSPVMPYVDTLVRGYKQICEAETTRMRELTEFFGLRDFYSLMKMVVNFAANAKEINGNHLEHSIRRNFGGLEGVDPMEFFEVSALQTSANQRPPVDTIGIIESSLSGEDNFVKITCNKCSERLENAYALPCKKHYVCDNCKTVLETSSGNGEKPVCPVADCDTDILPSYKWTPENRVESRYILILTENLSILSIILEKLKDHHRQPEVVFGSKFPEDLSYTKVCQNIFRIKTCMDIGKPVILLNLDDLYESLYDALNQYFFTMDDQKFVDLGLGRHRVKTHVHDSFRLIVIADKNKVYSEFPIPLINRLEKHYVSATTLLSDRQKDCKKVLDDWTAHFVTPKRGQMICPSTCDMCSERLEKPYPLPCRRHYVCPCCKESVMDKFLNTDGSEKVKCMTENCDTEIEPGFVWAVDTTALENRQYFENTDRETCFVGYNAEMTSLAVLKATADISTLPCNEQQWKEIYKRSQLYALSCATGESVMRLDKTALYAEAHDIQTNFLRNQCHESLHQYLDNELNLCGDQSLFMQVTSFAELLRKRDITKLQADMNITNPRRVNVFNISVKDFAKEDQFIDSVRRFYSTQCDYEGKLLLVQCDAANQNTGLLDSVRYLLQRESETAKDNTHTLLVLSLPRGCVYNGYQGGKWKCAHVDDLREQQLKFLTLSKCIDLQPSQLIARLLSMKEEQNNKDLLLFILQCLPEALSLIKKPGIYEREPIIRRFLEHHQEFREIFLRHVCNLLKKQESNSRTHWVKANAVKASNMKQSETISHALEDALRSAIVPGLAAVFSFIDVQRNITVFEEKGVMRNMWLRIFKSCHELGLDGGHPMQKLPEEFIIRQVGKGTQEFSVMFPFSWIVKEEIDHLIMVASANGVETDVLADVVLEQFKTGTVIGKALYDSMHGNMPAELLDRYLADFVYISHPCATEDEHFIVGMALNSYLTKSKQGCITIVDLHLAYATLRTSFSNLSNILRLDWKAECGNTLASKVREEMANDKKELDCDLVGLECLQKHLSDISIGSLLTAPETWVDRVVQSFHVVLKVLDHHGIAQRSQISRNNWSRLILKKLFVEYVIIPSEPVTTSGVVKRKAFRLSFFMEKVKAVSFHDYQSFNEVQKWLREVIIEGVKQLYPGCEKNCKVCKQNEMHSPVRLPCSHLLCDTCAKELTLCVECKGTVPKDFVYNPAKDDRIEKVKVEELKQRRRRLDKFFMAFVSDVVFGAETEPDDQIIKWLLECVTFKGGTRQFSLYNTADVVDFRAPVLRSFLFKLLMQLTQSDLVDGYLNSLLAGWPDDQTRRVNTMVLLMDCHKDQFSPAANVNKVLKELKEVTQITEPSIKNLQMIAEVQCYLSYAVDALELMIESPQSQIKHLQSWEIAVKDYIDLSTKNGNPQPSYYMARCLFVKKGESLVKDMARRERFEYLIPQKMRSGIQLATVPDILSVHGGKGYKAAIDAIQKVIELSTDPKGQEAAVEEFRLASSSNWVMLESILVSKVTITFSQSVSKILYDKLRMVIPQHECMMLKMILDIDGSHLPEGINVCSTAGLNLAMLTLNLLDCMYNDTTMGDLHPLSELIRHPEAAATHLLPTMFDSQHEIVFGMMKAMKDKEGGNPRAFECKNGHPYVFGNCGNPNSSMVCPEYGCGLPIGAKGYNQLVHGNREVKPGDPKHKSRCGHVLGPARRITEAISERDLKPLACSVLRCLVHLCMYAGAVFTPEKVAKIVNGDNVAANKIQEYLMKHILLDMVHISDRSGFNKDDVILLLHELIERMRKAARSGPDEVLKTIERRKEWEHKFDTSYIKPTFTSTQETQRKIDDTRQKMEQGCSIKSLLYPDEKPLNNDHFLASQGLWDYKLKLTLARLQSMLQEDSSAEKQHPVLTHFVKHCDTISAIHHLPDVLELMGVLSEKFHSRLSRKDASEQTINDFYKKHRFEVFSLQRLIDNYIAAWNIMAANQRAAGQFSDDLGYNSPLSSILLDPHSRITGQMKASPPFTLIVYLIDTHNSLINIKKEQLAHLELSAISNASVVELQNTVELIGIVLTHAEYVSEEVGETQVGYKWDAIEREIDMRYRSGKPIVDFTADKLKYFVFEDDFNLHNQLTAIRASQEWLGPELQAKLSESLPDRVPPLTAYLKDIKIAINFIYGTKVDRGFSLAKFMKSFATDVSYLSEDVKLRHIKDVWLLLKYTQTKVLMKQNQEPFDDIESGCRETLPVDLKNSLSKCCRFNDPNTKILLQELFKYIILHLNKVAASAYQLNPNRILRDDLMVFVEDSANTEADEKLSDLVLEKLPTLPENILVKHAPNAWKFIWMRYTNAAAK